MPRYFFHIRDGDLLIRDDEGSEFEDLQTAIAEAWHSARDLAVDQIRGGRSLSDGAIELSDGGDNVLLSVPLRSVLG